MVQWLSFETNKLNTNNSKRYELETNYVSQLYQYLDKLCGAKVMVVDRQYQLEKHIESFKQIIGIDIETNRNYKTYQIQISTVF